MFSQKIPLNTTIPRQKTIPMQHDRSDNIARLKFNDKYAQTVNNTARNVLCELYYSTFLLKSR
jgi:hypothetical protein